MFVRCAVVRLPPCAQARPVYESWAACVPAYGKFLSPAVGGSVWDTNVKWSPSDGASVIDTETL